MPKPFNPGLPPTPDRLDPAWTHVLRHIAGNAGWVTAGYLDSDNYTAVRDQLIADGYIQSGSKGTLPVYELTDAGWAWLDARGSR
jgi:hypothetical protein